MKCDRAISWKTQHMAVMLINATAMARQGSPAEIANVCHFIASKREGAIGKQTSEPAEKIASR